MYTYEILYTYRNVCVCVCLKNCSMWIKSHLNVALLLYTILHMLHVGVVFILKHIVHKIFFTLLLLLYSIVDGRVKRAHYIESHLLQIIVLLLEKKKTSKNQQHTIITKIVRGIKRANKWDTACIYKFRMRLFVFP